MTIQLLKLPIRSEGDAISSRKLAQDVADLAGLTSRSKTKIATAVSEIARNALRYAGGGFLICSVVARDREQLLEFAVSDDGPGINGLDTILAGEYRSRTGMGLGIHGSSKLVDEFEVREREEGGTLVRMAMKLPVTAGTITNATIEGWKGALVRDEESRVEVASSDRDDVMRALRVLKLKERELEQQPMESEKEKLALKATQSSLKEQATIDVLTSLLNRRSLMQTLEVEINRAVRSGRSLSVGLADLDHFKKLNDTFGHVMGDAVLVEAAARMERVMRPYDSVGRYGGEEFIFLFPNCNEEDACQICDRVRTAIADRPIAFDDMETTVTASFGLSSTSMSTNPKEIVDLADAALYRAKEDGRNRVEISTPADYAKLLNVRSTYPSGGPTS